MFVPMTRSGVRFFLLCTLALAARALPLKRQVVSAPYLPTS
jgi:hypothetical protein